MAPTIQALRQQRQQVNQKMGMGAAVNPKLEAQKAALNQQIRDTRQMPNGGLEAMPRVGPQIPKRPTGDGRTAPTGDGRTAPQSPISDMVPWANGEKMTAQPGTVSPGIDLNSLAAALAGIAGHQSGAQEAPQHPLAGLNPLDPNGRFNEVGGAMRAPTMASRSPFMGMMSGGVFTGGGMSPRPQMSPDMNSIYEKLRGILR